MKTSIRAILLPIFCLLSLPASAGDLWVDIHGLSIHSSSSYSYKQYSGDYNWANLGAGVGYALTPNVELKAGAYWNSYENLSVYAGARFGLRLPVGDSGVIVDPGLTVGVVTGYEDTPDEAAAIQPVILPGSEHRVQPISPLSGIYPRRS